MSSIDKEQIARLREKAEKQIQAGKWVKALELYDEIAKIDPKNDRVMHRLGDIYLKLGEKEQAKESYKRLSELYAKNGFWAKAISTNKLVLNLDPNDTEVQESITRLYSHLGIQSKPGKTAEKTNDNPPVVAPVEAKLELDSRRRLPASHAQSTASNYANMMDMYSGTLIDLSDQPLEEPPELPAKVAAPPAPALPPPPPPSASDLVIDIVLDGAIDISQEEVIELEDEVSASSQFQVPLFSDFSPTELNAIIARLNVRKFPAQATICQAGESGDSMFIIASGSIEVWVNDGKSAHATIAKLKSGDFFGEFGLLSDGKRHASVTADTAAELMEITRADFREIASKHPHVVQVLDQYYRQRLIESVLRQNQLLCELTAEARAHLLERFELRKVTANTYLFKEGDEGGDLYFIKSGTFEVSVKRFKDHVVIAHLGTGDFFGEMALVTGQRRNASIRAEGPGEVLFLAKDVAMEIIERTAALKERLESVVVARAEDAIAAYKSHQALKKEMALV